MSTTHYIAFGVFGGAAPGAGDLAATIVLGANVSGTLGTEALLGAQISLGATVTASLSTLTPLPSDIEFWPVGLPQYFLVDGYQESPGESWIRTPMEVGPGKVRRRYTAMPRTVVGAVILTRAESLVLRDFFVITLDGGTKPFLWEDPRSGAPQTFRFTARPVFEPIVPDLWRAKLSLQTVL